eukprot:3505465-Prymnesium_polylepis.2
MALADRDKLQVLMKRGASAEAVRSYLDQPVVGCFTSGWSNGLLILRRVKGGIQEFRASAHVLASILGVPLELEHPIRLGLNSSATPRLGRS